MTTPSDGHQYTEEQIHQVARQFNQRTVSADHWTHTEHLVVAFWYLHQFNFFDAYCRMKAGIILLNQVHGTPNSEDRGYHETYTWFWFSVLHLWITAHPGMSLDETCNQFLSSPLADKQFPLHFYTQEELKSPGHRAIAVEPVMKALTWESVSVLL
jgi:hypothetical protein